jgi:hypothetical protein
MAGVGDVGVPALQMSANPKVFLPQDEKTSHLFSPPPYTPLVLHISLIYC